MTFPIQREIPRAPARLSVFLFVTVLLLLFAPQKMRAEPGVSKEYEVKAAFLFHFAQFVEWPASKFTAPSAPFCVGVLGNNPFGGALGEIVKGETIDSHKLIVEYSQRPEDLKNCQIVFIAKTEQSRLPKILVELNRQNILTVSECEGFVQRGGVINFYLQDGKVRFEINAAAAERENLKISSQLLRLGKIVKT